MHWVRQMKLPTLLTVTAISLLAIGNMALVVLDISRRGFYPWFKIGVVVLSLIVFANWVHRISRYGAENFRLDRDRAGVSLVRREWLTLLIVTGVIIFVTCHLVRSK